MAPRNLTRVAAIGLQKLTDHRNFDTPVLRVRMHAALNALTAVGLQRATQWKIDYYIIGYITITFIENKFGKEAQLSKNRALEVLPAINVLMYIESVVMDTAYFSTNAMGSDVMT